MEICCLKYPKKLELYLVIAMFMAVKFKDGSMYVVRIKNGDELNSKKSELEKKFRIKLVGANKTSGGFIFHASEIKTPIWKSGKLPVERKEDGTSSVGSLFGEGRVHISDKDAGRYIWEKTNEEDVNDHT